ncbi:MAG: PAS domain-containing protein [Candidatus Methanoperedenaceae archaeon]|nr:PAS domain-containing protein [Candidatus Methanoperedenaceae archaeon]
MVLEDGIILYSLIIQVDREKASRIIESAIKEKKPYDLEYRIRHKDGNIRYLTDRGRPVYGPDDKLLHFDGVIFDITDSKRAEEELSKINAGLEQRVKERTAELKKQIAEYEKKSGITDKKQ